MAQEKKKGFWSWLGFGKKSEQPVEPEQQIAEQVEEINTENTAQGLVEQTQAVSSEAENAVEKLAEKTVDIAEQQAEKAEAVLETVVETVAETVEHKSEVVNEVLKTEALVEQTQAVSSEAENVVENVAEKIVDIAEPQAEKIEAVLETVVETVEQKSETLSEALQTEELAEQVQAVSSEAENTVEKLAEKTVDIAEQQAEKAEAVLETVAETVEEKSEVVNEALKTEAVAETVETFAENVAEERVEQAQAVSSQAEIANELPVADVAENDEPETGESVEPQADYQEKPAQEGGFFHRLIKGLIKTKQSIGSGFRNFFRGKKIDDELFEELEEQLLVADLGMPTTTKIIQNLTQHATKQQLREADLLYQQLKIELSEVLKTVAQPLVVGEQKPYVILMVGVNGVGKTTTIGKLARKFQQEGKSVMLAAGDTFRAAAVEQLQVWGERNQIPVVAQSTGADSASVIFDAMQSAAAKGVDVLIADTAGRLQNKNNLMDELKKIVRVMKKYDETAPHEIMLTLDAGTGQNAISQAKLFNEAVGLTGITLTKLDGTAKGGVIFAIADQFNIPIRFIGVGEKIEDLRPFDAEEFIDALFTHEDEK